MASYRNEFSRTAKTPDAVRRKVGELEKFLGDVLVVIGVDHGFDGCAPPIWTTARRARLLTDEELAPILKDYPVQTARICPVF